eukprot:c4601_g1_i1.p1 GENE.c4601_g1_i1~~c4601_g1_i1.p1  ORF type:complete len:162 (-),score=27.45 c4601_g1_i1:44-529(-)
MDEGKLVPDELLIPMVSAYLARPEVAAKGWLLDGFPRTSAQAQALVEVTGLPDVFLLLEVDEKELTDRVTGRRIDSETGTIYHIRTKPPPPDVPASRLIQRSDDTEEKLKSRLKEFHENISQVIGTYESVKAEIDVNHSPDEAWLSVRQAIYTSVKKRVFP